MIALFWILVGAAAYSFVGYGVLAIVLGWLRPSRPAIPPARPLQVTLLIAAYNEAAHIGRKIDEALKLDIAAHQLEIVVVSDGSTDGTAAEVRAREHSSVRLIDIPENHGKISALNTALAQIEGDIVVFSDANSRLRPDALLQLLKHFGDPNVGGVCGNLNVSVRRHGWLGRAERAYWRYDNALKAAESRISSAVSAQGSLYAVRRSLISPLPSAVADDLVTSLRVVANGRRLVFEPRSITEEGVSDNVSGEFGRRVRSTERGWRGLMLMKALLNPRRHGIYSIQLFSHKVLRRLNAFLLPLLYPASLLLIPEGSFYVAAAAAQTLFYGVAVAAFLSPSVRRVPGTSLPLFFVMGHLAMALGIWHVVIGRRSDRWIPVREGGASPG